MNEMIQIQWTAGSIDEARRICRHLVKERLVACAEIIPWVESIYQWDNQLETTQESKIIMKTLKSHYEKVQDFILKNSSYQVPEILSISIDQINPAYLAWLEESILEVKK